jgi:hypothetical protein
MADGVHIAEVPEEYSRNPEHAEVGEDYRDMPNVMVMGLQEDNEHGLDESAGRVQEASRRCRRQAAEHFAGRRETRREAEDERPAARRWRTATSPG